MKKIATACFVLALIVSLPLLNLAACAGPSYYAQAVSGHLRLMRQRENITEILVADSADADLRRELRGYPESDEHLKRAVAKAMALKPRGHDFNLKGQPVIFRHMNMTGG